MSLNSKKSWHPGKGSNIAKVQKREEDEIESRRRSERRRLEIEQERSLAGSHEAEGPSAQQKLGWMYSERQPNPPTSLAKSTASTQTSLLLGANKIDERMLAEKQAAARDARGAARKLEADPMAGILAKNAGKTPRRRGKGQRDGKVSKSNKHG